MPSTISQLDLHLFSSCPSILYISQLRDLDRIHLRVLSPMKAYEIADFCHKKVLILFFYAKLPTVSGSEMRVSDLFVSVSSGCLMISPLDPPLFAHPSPPDPMRRPWSNEYVSAQVRPSICQPGFFPRSIGLSNRSDAHN